MQPLTIADALLGQLADETLGRLQAAEVIQHRGERGRAREVVLADFLRSIVPPGFAVGTGFVIDSQGGLSRQQDIVIHRRDYHPVFSIGGVNYFPVESVAVVAEVKSTLNKRTFSEALVNGLSVKSLDRTAGGLNYVIVGGSGGPWAGSVDPENGAHQVMTLVLAGSSGRGLETITAQLWEHLAEHPRRVWPNLVGIAGECILGYSDPQSLLCEPMTSTGLTLQEPSERSAEPLIAVAHSLLSALRVAALIDYRPNQYIRTRLQERLAPFPEDFPPR